MNRVAVERPANPPRFLDCGRRQRMVSTVTSHIPSNRTICFGAIYCWTLPRDPERARRVENVARFHRDRAHTQAAGAWRYFLVPWRLDVQIMCVPDVPFPVERRFPSFCANEEGKGSSKPGCVTKCKVYRCQEASVPVCGIESKGYLQTDASIYKHVSMFMSDPQTDCSCDRPTI